ncbi:hypothetical protein BZA05DRAFT_219781 [Tricharina praecox]|uniref:uncharacterized protein n=1 Tax=Tricharina praecox TaxID=43433 RepID=UPI00221FA1E8|nr:uncharacterized protein BZA05DRAFT_219781 [Tricharina praecox]KAI5855863.1 hypothetical protein BZA05DRAFT_219781 [Tricharina praecox]
MVTATETPGAPVAVANGVAKPKQKLSKNQLRRAKKKQQKAGGSSRESSVVSASESESESEPEKQQSRQPLITPDEIPDFELDDLGIDENDPTFSEYRKILDRFRPQDHAAIEEEKGEVMGQEDFIPDEDEEKEEPKLSKKARKARNKLSVAELKALVKRPETVEWTDTSANDPRLLVHLKSYRNCVPVPTHWSLKREYLSSKRGIEKPPFELPKFIKDTGIMEMRDSVREKEESQSMKSKMRERVQPKMGKLDIDYQKLHDAFFRFQTKPTLTMYGEVYYEGKEFETNLKGRRPGELSEELKEALNMPPGAPPPWLINMQRFGPPPSYPSLKIPGLNAPIPPGAQWGFHPGGYGKPPTDEYNRPLYGDVFGVLQPQAPTQTGEPVEKTLWGELQEEEEESEEEEDEDEEDEEEEAEEESVAHGIQTPSGTETPSGMVSSVPSEFEPVDQFELRKRRDGTETEEDAERRSLYQVLPEHSIKTKGFFGGERAYDIKNANANLPVLGQEDRKRKKPGDVDVALDPSQLEEDGLTSETVKRRYEQAQEEQRRERQGFQFQEDLSDMIAQESRKRQKREEENAKRKKEKYRF